MVVYVVTKKSSSKKMSGWISLLVVVVNDARACTCFEFLIFWIGL